MKGIYLAVWACAVSFGLFTSSFAAAPSTKTILIEGATIRGGVNGVAFDGENNFYAASIFAHEIYKIDPETGEMLDTFDPSDGVLWPEEIAIGPDNSLYWASFFMGEVGKLSADRLNVSRQSITPFITSLAFSSNGRLTAAADIFGSGLYELDPTLINPPRLIDENISSSSIAFNPDHLLYGAVIFGEQIIKVDIDQGTTDVVVDALTLPGSVRFDSQGNLYASDMSLEQILAIDEQTNTQTIFAGLGAGGNRFAFDSNDRLFISNFFNGSISEIGPNGHIREVLKGGLVTPNGISVSTNGDKTSIFVGNIHTLLEFDGETGEKLSEEYNYLTEGSIISPITVSPDGSNLVLSSWVFPAVQVWNPETKEIIAEYNDFLAPVNAIRYQDSLIVADLGENFSNPRVVMRNAQGDTILADGASGLVTPAGLVAKDGNLWVGDWSTGKILQLIRDGQQLPGPTVVAKGLSQPEGLAIDAKGRMLVVETGKRKLSRIKFREGKKPKIKKIAKKLGVGNTVYPSTVSVAPPTYFFSDVAIDEKGIIYVSGDKRNVVYRIEMKKKKKSKTKNGKGSDEDDEDWDEDEDDDEDWDEDEEED